MEGSRVENNRTFGMIALGRSFGDINIPGISAEPEVHQYYVSEDDRWIVLACDGVFDVLTNDYIGTIASKSNSASELACDIRNLAYANLSTDNITVIVVDIKERKKEILKMAKENPEEMEKMDDVSDDGDDENFSVTPVHIHFDLKDVDPSLYMSSGLFSCTSSSWSFLSKETYEGMSNPQLYDTDVGNSILQLPKQPSTFEDLDLKNDVEIPIVAKNKNDEENEEDNKSQDAYDESGNKSSDDDDDDS